MPTTPAHTIMTVENTNSRASVGLLAPCSIIVTMIDASIAVTANVSSSVPYGSPTRAAIVSAWCSTTNTVAKIKTATRPSNKVRAGNGQRSIDIRPRCIDAARPSETIGSPYLASDCRSKAKPRPFIVAAFGCDGTPA